MKAKKYIGMIGILFSTSVFALPGDGNIAQKSGVYLKMQTGMMIPEKELDSELGDHTNNNISVWGRYLRAKYVAGYQFDRTVAMQIGYFQAVHRAGNGDSVDANYRSRLSYWDFAAVGLLPVSDHVSVTGLLGVALAQQVVTGSTSSVTPNENVAHVTPEVGMGAQYHFTPHLAVSVEPFFVFASGSIHAAFFIPVGVSYIF